MPQKITLTGTPATGLRIVKELMGKDHNAPKVYSFDMQESGSPAAPKYLPKGSSILFTVFMNEKQLKKAGLDEKTFKDNKLLVQGEIVIDLEMSLCPGELGVAANQIQIIPPREQQADNGKATEGA